MDADKTAKMNRKSRGKTVQNGKFGIVVLGAPDEKQGKSVKTVRRVRKPKVSVPEPASVGEAGVTEVNEDQEPQPTLQPVSSVFESFEENLQTYNAAQLSPGIAHHLSDCSIIITLYFYQ